MGFRTTICNTILQKSRSSGAEEDVLKNETKLKMPAPLINLLLEPLARRPENFAGSVSQCAGQL